MSYPRKCQLKITCQEDYGIRKLEIKKRIKADGKSPTKMFGILMTYFNDKDCDGRRHNKYKEFKAD